jgi:hypothetical protein
VRCGTPQCSHSLGDFTVLIFCMLILSHILVHICSLVCSIRTIEDRFITRYLVSRILKVSPYKYTNGTDVQQRSHLNIRRSIFGILAIICSSIDITSTAMFACICPLINTSICMGMQRVSEDETDLGNLFIGMLMVRSFDHLIHLRWFLTLHQIC